MSFMWQTWIWISMEVDVCMDKYGEVVTQFRVEIEIFINLTCILKYTN